MVKIKKQKVHFKKRKGAQSSYAKKKNRINIKVVSKFLGAFIVLSLIGFGFVILKYMFVDSDYFIVKAVDAEFYDWDGFSRKTSFNEVRGKRITGRNIFFIDLNELKEQIEVEHPEFKGVVVRRLLPDKLIVKANLRKAIAQVHSDRYYFIDAAGILLPDVKNFPDAKLPIITGIGINLAKLQPDKFSQFKKDKLDKGLNLLREMEVIKELSAYRLRLIDITDPGNISFFLEGINVELKIGNSDFAKRLKVLATVLEQIGSDIDKFRYIDLRFDDPIIGPR